MGGIGKDLCMVFIIGSKSLFIEQRKDIGKERKRTKGRGGEKEMDQEGGKKGKKRIFLNILKTRIQGEILRV